MAALQRSALCAFWPSAWGGGFAVGAKLCVDRYEVGPAVNNLDALNRRSQLEHPRVAPVPPYRAVTQLGNRLER